MRLTRDIRVFLLAALLSVPLVAQAVQGEPAYLQAVLMNGEEFDLEKHRGKVVMVNFWATWCPACRADFPVWQRVYDGYRGRDFEMVAVSIDREDDPIHKFLKKHAYTVPVGWRFDEREDDSFPKIRNTPTTYFIGRDGKVAMLRVGRMKEAELRRTVEGLLQQ
jgi:thiol-disulfide isomerase/thioredoxin